MNDTEIERIAGAINQLRPDWPIPSLRTILRRPELAARSRRDVAVALSWVACEADSRSPARVIEPGPWWHAANVTGESNRYPPRRDQECRRHSGEWSHACRSCAAEVKGGPGYCEDDDTPAAGGWDAARVREQLRRATTTEETE